MPTETGSAPTAPAPAQPPLPLPLPQRHLLQGALILCWSRRRGRSTAGAEKADAVVVVAVVPVKAATEAEAR